MSVTNDATRKKWNSAPENILLFFLEQHYTQLLNWNVDKKYKIQIKIKPDNRTKPGLKYNLI